MLNKTQKDCVQACLECAKACDACASACLSERDIEGLRRCIRLDLDCADICTQAARSIQRESDFQLDIAALAAEICARCADECRRHAADMLHCRLAAEAAEKCSAACALLSGVSVQTI